MALSLFSRNGLPTDVTPSHDELVNRVNVLAGNVERLTRLVESMQRLIEVDRQVANRPARSLADCDTPRKIMQYVGRIAYTNGAPDTEHLKVRSALERDSAFASMRAQVE